jgi:hypothetical protein
MKGEYITHLTLNASKEINNTVDLQKNTDMVQK